MRGTGVMEFLVNATQAAANVADTVLGFLIVFAAIGVVALLLGVIGFVSEHIGRKQ